MRDAQRGRGAILILGLALLLLAACQAAAAASVVDPPGPAPPVRTHGPDPPAVSAGPLAAPGRQGACLLIVFCPRPAPAPTPTPAPAPATPTWACATDDYFVAILVGNGAKSTADGAKVARARAAIAEAGRIMMAAGRDSGGPAPRPKFKCGADGNPIVYWGWQAPANAEFGAVYGALWNAGLGRNANEKFALFYDGALPGKCGVSTGDADPRAGPTNRSNLGPEWSVMYSNCWNGPTLLHELTHAMGAVNPAAPHYYYVTGGHCDDEPDVMCYGPLTRILCARPAYHFEHYDCHHDTYFDTAPAAGSWVATHWQVGSPDNRWLAFG